MHRGETTALLQPYRMISSACIRRGSCAESAGSHPCIVEPTCVSEQELRRHSLHIVERPSGLSQSRIGAAQRLRDQHVEMAALVSRQASDCGPSPQVGDDPSQACPDAAAGGRTRLSRSPQAATVHHAYTRAQLRAVTCARRGAPGWRWSTARVPGRSCGWSRALIEESPGGGGPPRAYTGAAVSGQVKESPGGGGPPHAYPMLSSVALAFFLSPHTRAEAKCINETSIVLVLVRLVVSAIY